MTAVTESLIDLIEDGRFADAVFVYWENDPQLAMYNDSIRAALIKTVRILEDDIDRSFEEVHRVMTQYGYRRVVFHSEDGLFGPPYAARKLRKQLTKKLQEPLTSSQHLGPPVYYMDPDLEGTYGYVSGELTAEDLNRRMRIIRSDWIDIVDEY